MNTMNMWSNAGVVMGAVLHCSAGEKYADLVRGWRYSLLISNQTNADITSGTIELEWADALPDNPCAPGEWGPLDPVAGCGPIVSGVPETGPVKIEIAPDRPIPARSECAYSIPCPKQFVRVSSAPAGLDIMCIIDRPRRSDHSHLGAYGGIPPPIQLQSPIVPNPPGGGNGGGGGGEGLSAQAHRRAQHGRSRHEE